MSRLSRHHPLRAIGRALTRRRDTDRLGELIRSPHMAADIGLPERHDPDVPPQPVLRLPW